MARTPTWPPKVYRHKSGQARLRWKGTDYYLGPYGSAEAKVREADLIRQITAQQQQSTPLLSDATVQQLCAAYLNHLEQTAGQRRELENIRLGLKPLVRLFGQTPAALFDASDLEAVQQAMASGTWLTADEGQWRLKRSMPLGWSRNYANQNLARIKSVWRWAEKRKLVPRGSWEHLRSVDGLRPYARGVRNTTKRQATRYEDLQAVLQHCSAPVAAMLELQWWGGMRSGELRILRTCDIDRTCQPWRYRPASHKNAWRGQERVIILGPECQRVLSPWLRDDAPEAYLFRPADVPKANRAKLDHYSRHAYAQAVRRACQKAGVKIQPYGGRYATAQRVSAVAGLEGARQVLGQKSVAVTSHYAGLDADAAAEIMKECG